MKNFLPAILLLFTLTLSAQQQRVPAYPLVTHSPYFSIWSTTDRLNESVTTHWTGTAHALNGLLLVDGIRYNFLGKPETRYATVLPTSVDEPYSMQYTLSAPQSSWFQSDFDDSGWKTGKAPFANNTVTAGTVWKTNDIWLRRTFNIDSIHKDNYALRFYHDDNVAVYLNDILIFEKEGWVDQLEFIDLNDKLKSHLRKGKNVLAIHCKNTAGGQHVDIGISRELPHPSGLEIRQAEQRSSRVNALQTVYTFACGPVDLELKFTSPLLPGNLDLVSRPVTYISYKVRTTDGKPHDVSIYLAASTAIAVNDIAQEVQAEKFVAGQLSVLKAGTVEQPVLQKKGDNLRIDWGYFYVAVPGGSSRQHIGTEPGFGSFPDKQEVQQHKGRQLSLETIIDLGRVDNRSVEKYMMLGYDEVYSIQYFHQNLRPWWDREGKGKFEQVLKQAADTYSSVMQQVQEFDQRLYKEAAISGGENYARLCELAYRQSIAAHVLVESPQKEMLFLSKENFSNGSVNTVDVTYPSAPLYLLYNPALLKGMLNGIFYYSESGKWQKPFPAHDLGTYPIANGQTYGEDMPVEEAGNMLLLTAAICMVENDAVYALKHWPVLQLWANYLEQEGLDPANQLCTDDFAGHLARNANLSLKAITALGAFGKVAAMAGKQHEAQKYAALSQKMGKEWMKLSDAGNRYALTFDDKNTWSQKYNLIWDKLLKLNIFPAEVYSKELTWYLGQQQSYGLPLDSRKTYTKSDWIMWTATMSDDPEVFRKLTDPIYRFVVETADRVPLSDWHETLTGRKTGFQARSVVGGYYMKMLKDKMTGKR